MTLITLRSERVNTNISARVRRDLRKFPSIHCPFTDLYGPCTLTKSVIVVEMGAGYSMKVQLKRRPHKFSPWRVVFARATEKCATFFLDKSPC